MSTERKSSTLNTPSPMEIDFKRDRFPYSIVWTPIPCLTWIFPFIGHMGIAMSNGVIRDFAGPYTVTEDHMAFGRPTKYLQLDPTKVRPPLPFSESIGVWDLSVMEASDVYKTRMHNLFCDNCHSHVAMALNRMEYENSTNWNMFRLACQMFIFGKYVNILGILKTWVPFIILVVLTTLIFCRY